MVAIKRVNVLPRRVEMELVFSVPLWCVAISSRGDAAGIGKEGGLYVTSPPFRKVEYLPFPSHCPDMFWVSGTSILAVVLDEAVRFIRASSDGIEVWDVASVSLPPINSNTLTISATGRDYGLPFGLRVREGVLDDVYYLTDDVRVNKGMTSGFVVWYRFADRDWPVIAFANNLVSLSASVSGKAIKLGGLLIVTDDSRRIQQWYELPNMSNRPDQSPFPDIGFACRSGSDVFCVSFRDGVVGYRANSELLGYANVGLLPDGRLLAVGEKGICVSKSPVV